MREIVRSLQHIHKYTLAGSGQGDNKRPNCKARCKTETQLIRHQIQQKSRDTQMWAVYSMKEKRRRKVVIE